MYLVRFQIRVASRLNAKTKMATRHVSGDVGMFIRDRAKCPNEKEGNVERVL